jgi:histidyl-tRNA synthetase
LPEPRAPRCFVVAIGDEARRAGVTLVADLRAAGIAATSSYEERPLKAQLKMADRAGAAFAGIVGEKELADGTVTLRRLADGVQESVPTADLPRWLSGDGAA